MPVDRAVKNGGRSLILVADNGGPENDTNNNHFYALRLTIPEPTAATLMLTIATVLLPRRGRGS